MTPHPLSQSRQLQATMQLIAQRKQQVGPVAVTFSFGRIQSRSNSSAADTGSSSNPVNLPAASDDHGGGLLVSTSFHSTGDN